MVKVKICGIANLEDALFCFHQGADALGFIFTKKSPRYIKPNTAKSIISSLGPFIIKVGVFMDENKEKVFNLASFLKLDVLQFHGSESPKYCAEFCKQFKVIKVIFPQDVQIKKEVSRYKKVDGFLFDIKYKDKQKEKNRLADNILKDIAVIPKLSYKVIVSGGLNTGNISKVLKKISPYAVDVSSGVEEFVGKKDKKLVHTFIRKVKYEAA